MTKHSYAKNPLMLGSILSMCLAFIANGNARATLKNVGDKVMQQQLVHQKVFSGIVKDAKGEPLIGVSVVEKGTSNGVITDLNGHFSLKTKSNKPTLTFSYIGYSTQNILPVSAEMPDVVLKEEGHEIGEVVVTALGIKREQKALSYNVQQIKGDKLTTVKDANFVNSLVGKVAGVQINAGAAGAGGAVRVVMRGSKSIEKGNNVLYVIDGIPMYNHSFGGADNSFGTKAGSESSADINPEDIESINMLTGPSAAALYGSDAANGVIIINTKKGSKEKTSVTISNSSTFSTATMLPKIQHSYGTSNGLYSWGERKESVFEPSKFFNTGSNIINAISLSTGNKNNQTYLSVSTTNAKGIVQKNTYERYNFTARNTTSFLQDKLVLDFGLNYILQKDANFVSQGIYNNPLPSLYLFPAGDDFNEVRNYERWDPVLGYKTQYWPYGEGVHSLQNPYWVQNKMQRTTNKQRYMMNASLKWNILSWLNATGRVRIDNSYYRLLGKNYASTLKTFSDVNGGYSDENQSDRSVYADVMLSANKRFNNLFSLNANIGASINDQRFESAGGAGNLLLINFFALNNLNYSNKYKTIQEGWHDQTQSVFASFELGYKDLLYLTLTGRTDWASQLAFSDQSSFFYPSVGLSAIVSNMAKLPSFVNFLKVRASYSKVASAFSRYLSNPSYEFDNQAHIWKKSNVAPLEHMKPEDTKSWEFGVNGKFLHNIINVDLTLYRSNTYHQTIYGKTSSSSLYSSQIVQTGNVQNQGVELAIGFNKSFGKVDVSSTLTYTLNQNKIIELSNASVNKQGVPEIQKSYLGASSVAPQVILYEGGSMSDIYIKHELKRDPNGNIAIDPATGNLSIKEVQPRKAGQLAPLYNLGWSNNISYQGFNLGFVLAARVGGLVYSATQGILDYHGASQASADARNNNGIDVNYGKVSAQKYFQAISTPQGGFGAYYLYSATNVRLQELSLTYCFPKKWFNNKLNLSVGVVGRNLCMIYCKAPFDPELTGSTTSNYYQGVDFFMQPATRNIGFNVKLQF